jgi:hypothetical protein
VSNVTSNCFTRNSRRTFLEMWTLSALETIRSAGAHHFCGPTWASGNRPLLSCRPTPRWECSYRCRCRQDRQDDAAPYRDRAARPAEGQVRRSVWPASAASPAPSRAAAASGSTTNRAPNVAAFAAGRRFACAAPGSLRGLRLARPAPARTGI